jgi:phosphate transport system ATP-binding protein
VEATGFGVHCAGKVLLSDITLQVLSHQVTAIIGPGESGKSLFLKCINRLAEIESPVHISGRLNVFGQNVYESGVELPELRRRVGMIFSQPTHPVVSIYDNVAMAPRLSGVADRHQVAHIVEQKLKQVGLWAQLCDRLSDAVSKLPVEIQQRICVARVLAADPVLLLMDHPTMGLDFPSALHFEDLICELADQYPIILTAQTPQQAAHVADVTAFFWAGRLVEIGATEQIITCPKSPQTEAYVSGRYNG